MTDTATVYPRKWRWPQDQKIAMSVGLAFEAFTYRSQFNTLGGAARAGNNPSPLSLSYAEYGWKAGVWRLLETLDRYRLRANMSVSAQAAEQHPNVIAAVVKAGHEINGVRTAVSPGRPGVSNDMPNAPKPSELALSGFLLLPTVSDHIAKACLPGAYPAAHWERVVMRTKLTPGFCLTATAEPGRERSVYWDASLPGFGLMVTKNGHRSFVVQYRIGGRSRRMTVNGVLGLVPAKKRAKALLGTAAHDVDPLDQRRKKQAQAADTFQSVSDNFLERDGRELRSLQHRRSMLKRLVYPAIGERPIGDIRRSEIVRLLDKIEDGSGPVAADRALAAIRRVFNWHASRADEFRSPIVRRMARTNGVDRRRNRILSDDELRAVWKAAGKFDGPFGAFVKFLLLTGARRSEAAAMPWREIETDADGGATWFLPAVRNKVKCDLVRPLSVTALTIIDALPRIGGRGLVFTTHGYAPLGGFSKLKTKLDMMSGVTGWRLHDLRRTARSLMSRAGVPSDHAELCLGHVLTGVRSVYDRHGYYTEKRHAFEALAALIDRIVNPQSNVVPLTATLSKSKPRKSASKPAAAALNYHGR